MRPAVRLRHEPVEYKPRSLWRMISTISDLRLPSWPHNIVVVRPLPSYTTWWRRHVSEWHSHGRIWHRSGWKLIPGPLIDVLAVKDKVEGEVHSNQHVCGDNGRVEHLHRFSANRIIIELQWFACGAIGAPNKAAVLEVYVTWTMWVRLIRISEYSYAEVTRRPWFSTDSTHQQFAEIGLRRYKVCLQYGGSNCCRENGVTVTPCLIVELQRYSDRDEIFSRYFIKPSILRCSDKASAGLLYGIVSRYHYHQRNSPHSGPK